MPILLTLVALVAPPLYPVLGSRVGVAVFRPPVMSPLCWH